MLFNTANQVAFVADPDAQPRNLGSAATNEVNLLDPDYKYPQVLRWNLGYDRSMLGLTMQTEFLYSKNVQDIFYKNLNYADSGATRPDGRPVMARVNTTFSDAFILTNTDEGDQWTASIKADKRMRNGFFASGSYLYGRSNTVNDGNSSTAGSNWRFLYTRGNSNVPVLGISDRDVRHRINLMASYRQSSATGWARRCRFSTTSSRAGRTRTTFSNDMNGDLQDNDILFVPANASDVVVRTARGTS